jgi:hypothetical protein
MLTEPVVKPSAYVMDLAVCGALLLALATTDLDRGVRTANRSAAASGARLTAFVDPPQGVTGCHDEASMHPVGFTGVSMQFQPAHLASQAGSSCATHV